MDRVLDRLWIGDARDLQAPLKSLGFSGVVDLRDGNAAIETPLDVHRLDNRDGDPWTVDQVKRTMEFIHGAIRCGKVLVVCAAGMSRSASMVIGYLVRSGWDEATAYEAVRRSRPKIAPVPGMLASVLEAVRP